MPTVADLGAQVKAKYPGVYDDLPNADLGAKVKAKYPGSYDDFTDAPQQSFGSALREYASKMNPVSIAKGAASTVNDILTGAKDWRAQNEKIAQDAEAAFHQGDYATAARHGLNYLLNAMPGFGSSLEEAGNKLQSGDYAGGLADTAALASQIAIGKAAPGAAKTAASIPGKIAEAVHSPGAAKITGGAAQLAGAAGSLASGHPFVAADLAVRGAQMLKNGIGERGAAAAEAAATGGHSLDLLNSLAESDFLKLSPEKQAQIRSIADRLDKPVPADLAKPPAGARNPGTSISAQPSITDDDFLTRYRAAVRPEDEAFLDQYNRSIKFPPAETQPEIPPGQPLLKEGNPPANGTPLRPPLAEPNPPAPQIPVPTAGGGGPVRPPLAGGAPAAPAPAPEAPPQTPARSLAQQLFDSMKRNGEIPPDTKPGQPIGEEETPNPEPFKEKARAARQTSAQTLAGVFRQFEIPSTDMGKVPFTTWEALSKASGLDWPASGPARLKLIRETTAQLKALEGGK